MKSKKGFEFSFMAKLILILMLLIIFLVFLIVKFKPNILGSISLFDVW